MDSFEKMLKEFKNLNELQQFSEAQHKTIIELSKKNQKLEEEVKHLKTLLDSQTPKLPIQQQEQSIIKSGAIIEDHEENICRMELKKLHDLSLERQLTYEETKKVEIYTKLLIAIQAKAKSNVIELKKTDTSDLLQLVQDNDNKESS